MDKTLNKLSAMKSLFYRYIIYIREKMEVIAKYSITRMRKRSSQQIFK